MKRFNGSGRRAFTLVELLAVIAIIAILVALLFPTIGKINARAHSAQCLSNLRQWGSAMNLYLSDSLGVFPQQGTGSGGGGGAAADPMHSNAWYNVLSPYLGEPAISNLWISRNMPRPRDKSIYVCPAVPPTPAPAPTDTRTYFGSYAMNLWIEAGNRGCSGDGDETSFPRLLRYSQIRNPAVFVIFADNPTGAGENGQYGYLYAWTHPTYMAFPAVGSAFRHDDRANLVFGDGHAGTFEKNNIYTNGMTDYWNLGGIQWNPDNPNLNGECQ